MDAAKPSASDFRSSDATWQHPGRLSSKDRPGKPPPLGCTSELPDPCRPSSARRPQRYLQDTVSKLADDSARTQALESTLRPASSLSGGSSTRPPTSLGTSGQDVGYRPMSALSARSTSRDVARDATRSAGLGETEMWRRAFHAEAGECIQALREVFDTANVSHFASRFEDWRKVDMKATAQMQQHVKQLSKLNQTADEFLSRSATPGGFENFRLSIETMAKCAEDLTAAKTEIGNSVDLIADRAAERVVASWRGETGAAVELLKKHLEAQRERWLRDAKREKDLDDRIGALKASIEQCRNDVRKQTTHIGDLEDAQRQSGHKAQGVSGGLRTLEQRLDGWVQGSLQEAADWKELAGRLEIDHKDVLRDQDKVTAQLDQQRAARERADELTADLQARLKESSHALADCEANMLHTSMSKLREIETRGLVRVNRQTGQLRLVQHIDFSLGATPAFADPGLASKLLEDVAEVGKMYNVPLSVDLHARVAKGSSLAATNELASGWAALVRAHLERFGLDPSLLTSRAVVPSSSDQSVLIQLDKAFFGAAEAKKRGASPTRR